MTVFVVVLTALAFGAAVVAIIEANRAEKAASDAVDASRRAARRVLELAADRAADRK